MNKEKVDCCELNTDNEYPILTMPDAEEDTNQMKKNKTATSFGSNEHIPPPVLDQDIWEKVDTEEEEEESQETSYKQYVIIDVGGERYQASRESFSKYPHTRLGKLVNSSNIEEILSLCEEFVPGNPPEFFFDRNPENFSAVLEMYRSGKFHIPDSGKGNLGLSSIHQV